MLDRNGVHYFTVTNTAKFGREVASKSERLEMADSVEKLAEV
jgi:hypothetical protein